MSTKTLMTVEQFGAMITADTENYELVEGELVPMSSGTPYHNAIRDNVHEFLRAYLKEGRQGKAIVELDCLVGLDTVRRPDVSVFLGDRASKLGRYEIPVPFAPDIAVEVLSPSERAIDVHRKVKEYLSAGASEVWLLDEDNQEVFTHATIGIRRFDLSESIETPLLPGFRASIAELFTF